MPGGSAPVRAVRALVGSTNLDKVLAYADGRGWRYALHTNAHQRRVHHFELTMPLRVYRPAEGGGSKLTSLMAEPTRLDRTIRAGGTTARWAVIGALAVVASEERRDGDA